MPASSWRPAEADRASGTRQKRAGCSLRTIFRDYVRGIASGKSPYIRFDGSDYSPLPSHASQ
jgi:hypothetical protein